ncbi:MAG: RHS repeat-associated core domain-containing protein, partial [Burkholderiaceae bacterium]
VISYTYGATSKDLERIAINGINAASAITYHPFGGVKRMTLGNTRVWSNSLDQDGRVKTYTLNAVTYTIAWDAANRITGITSSQTATNRTFGYDNLDRITSFSTTGRSQNFSYDATGNLTAKTDINSGTPTNYTFTIAPTSNRMTGISNLGIGYSFDAAGNRTGDGKITYAYNYRGRLNQVRIINGAVTNIYDYLINGVNLRVRKTGPTTVVPQGMQIFVYDDAAKLIGEYDDLGRARVEHVWLEDRPIAVITYTYTGTSTTPTTTTTSYVETDHLATPRLITNASRQKRWTWESAPYGDTFPNENPQALGAYKYNLRFPGQYFDAETNHHYNHHRDYESTTGRYVQSDPIGLAGGFNTYLYVDGNPLSFSDFLGLMASIPGCSSRILDSWEKTINKTTTEVLWSSDLPWAHFGSPKLGGETPDPRGGRKQKPPVKADVFEIWMTLHQIQRVRELQATEIYQRIQAWCRRTEMDECGNTRERIDYGNPVDSLLDSTGWIEIDSRINYIVRKRFRIW